MALKKKFEGQEAAGTDTAVLEAAAGSETTAGVGSTEGVETNTTATNETTVDAAAATATVIDNASESAAAATASVNSTAIAQVAAAKSLAVVLGKKYAPALEEYKNVFDPGSLAFNTFNRVTVDLGGFEDAEKNDLGDLIKLQMMSYNERFVVSPGVQDDDATQHVRYSLDGKTIEGTGESVIDYLKVLREVEGYKDASVKKYFAIYGFLVEANGAEIAPEDRQIVEIQVPPMSVPLFTRYQIETGVKISQGILPPQEILVCRSQKEQGKTTKYASIKFSTK